MVKVCFEHYTYLPNALLLPIWVTSTGITKLSVIISNQKLNYLYKLVVVTYLLMIGILLLAAVGDGRRRWLLTDPWAVPSAEAPGNTGPRFKNHTRTNQIGTYTSLSVIQ